MKKLLLYLGVFTVLIIIGFYGEIRKQVTGRSSHNDILYETYYGMIEYTFESTGVTHLVFQKANSDRSFCNELNEGYLLGLKTTCPDCVIKSESCSTSLPSAYQDIFSDKPMALPFLSAPNKRIVVLGIPVQQAISLCHEMAEAWRMGMNQEAKCITKTDSSASEIVDTAKTKTETAPVDRRNSAFEIDCTRAKTEPELAICSDPELRAYNRYLAEAYSKVHNTVTSDVFSEVRKKQLEWIRNRDAKCGGDVACLSRETQMRTAALNDFAQTYTEHLRHELLGDHDTVEQQRSSATTLQNQPLSPQEIYTKASQSVVVVLAFNKKEHDISLGSGVVLPDGNIATACHMIKDPSKVSVRYKQEEYPAAIQYTDWDRDICSLEVDGLLAPPAPVGSTMGLSIGDKVYAVGAPWGLELRLSEGIVSNLRSFENGQYIQTTAATFPGSSGGGLFDEKGHLLGLSSFRRTDEEGMSFFLPVEWITELPGRHSEIKNTTITLIDWFIEADFFSSQGEWLSLRDHAQNWTETMPKNSWAWLELGVAYYRLNQHYEAIDAYEWAVSIDPTLTSAWNNLGAAYGDTGQLSKAIVAYKRALSIDPEHLEAWNNLGIVYGKTDQISKAIDAFQHALDIDPEYAEAWNNLGVAYKETDQISKAIDAFQNAIRIDNEHALAWNNMGDAYGELGRYNEAIDAYRQAIRIDPEYATAWNNLGVAYANLGLYNEAIDAYRQAIRIDPEHANAWQNLAIAYYLSGNSTAALEVVQTLRQLDPVRAERLFDIIVPR